MCGHDLQESDGADEVVVVVKQGLLHALANSFQPGKMDDSLKPLRGEDLVQRLLVAEVNLAEVEVVGVVSGEFPDAEDGELGGVVEVVEDDNAEAELEKLEDGVAADVAGAARHQDRPQQGRNHLLLL